MAPAFRRRDPGPSLRAVPPGAGRPNAIGACAFSGVSARRHRRGGRRAQPSRPYASRHIEANGEALHRPALRLALAHPDRPERAAGRLRPPGVPTRDKAGSVGPCDPHRCCGTPPDCPDRPGAGAPGPQGPRLPGHRKEALGCDAPGPGGPRRLAQRLRKAKRPTAQERRTHRSGAWVHRGAGLPVPHPGMGGGPARPAPKGVALLPARRQAPLGPP